MMKNCLSLRDYIINTSTCIWQTQTFLVVCSNRSILCILCQLHQMLHLQNSSRWSWMTLSMCSHSLLCIFSLMQWSIRATHTNPICCFKADTHTTVCMTLRVPSLSADNPEQSEEASHMGGNANYKSCKSTKGGPPKITESDKGYHKLYTVRLRTISNSLNWLFSHYLYYSVAHHVVLQLLLQKSMNRFRQQCMGLVLLLRTCRLLVMDP